LVDFLLVIALPKDEIPESDVPGFWLWEFVVGVVVEFAWLWRFEFASFLFFDGACECAELERRIFESERPQLCARFFHSVDEFDQAEGRFDQVRSQENQHVGGFHERVEVPGSALHRRSVGVESDAVFLVVFYEFLDDFVHTVRAGGVIVRIENEDVKVVGAARIPEAVDFDCDLSDLHGRALRGSKRPGLE